MATKAAPTPAEAAADAVVPLTLRVIIGVSIIAGLAVSMWCARSCHQPRAAR
jgi:hypothetical protein